MGDADIAAFYAETTSGSGGDPPKGTIVAELIVKFFYGDFTPQGFKRYSGLWKGPPPGTIGKKDIKMGMEGLKAQMKNPMFVTKGGIGYGVDETKKVVDDGKGWVWIAAEMSPGGLAIELFKSTPFGKRALFCAKSANVDEMFEKINWGLMDKASTPPLAARRSSSGEPLVRCPDMSLPPLHGQHRSRRAVERGVGRLGRAFGKCHC